MPVVYWKNRQIEQGELGYWAPETRFVCDACIVDYALKDVVRDRATEPACDFCGRESDEPIAASTDAVLEHVGQSLRAEYDRPIDELGWDSEEKRYVGEVYDITDVLAAEGEVFANPDFETFVFAAFRESEWCEKDPYAMGEVDALRFSWELFVETVKHRARFLFVLADDRSYDEEPGAPVRQGAAMLEEIGRLVSDQRLVRRVEAGQIWYRVRVHSAGESYTSAADLGSPPPAAARQNRMSPAGISMFYGATDPETALAETVDPDDVEGKVATIAQFRALQPAQLIDLTELQSVPSIFDEDRRSLRPALGFLHGFVRDMSAPIERDDRVHIEYVPTQVVTEFFRHVYRDREGAAPVGILYRSSRRSEGGSVVLFCDPEDCLDEGAAPNHEGFGVAIAGSERRSLGCDG